MDIRVTKLQCEIKELIDSFLETIHNSKNYIEIESCIRQKVCLVTVKVRDKTKKSHHFKACVKISSLISTDISKLEKLFKLLETL